MIKIKLYEHHLHRNETTFRPFLMAQNLFRDVGIEFTLGDTYDYAFVGQASIIDKKKPLQESIYKGLEFVSKITGDYFIVAGLKIELKPEQREKNRSGQKYWNV